MHTQNFTAPPPPAAAPVAIEKEEDPNPPAAGTTEPPHVHANRRDRQRRYPQANLFNNQAAAAPLSANPQAQSMFSPIPFVKPPPQPQPRPQVQEQPQQPQPPQPIEEKRSRGVDIPVQAASVNDKKGSYLYMTYQPDERPIVLPPPPSTQLDVRVLDTGNCDPKYIRMSTYGVPATRDMNDSVCLPLGALVSPLAAPVAEGATVVARAQGPYYAPVRCARCGAYVNPHTEFTRDGKAMKCPVCRTESDVPDWYFSPLDMNGTRADASARPELRLGTVEYDVTDIPTYALPSSYIGKQAPKSKDKIVKTKAKLKERQKEASEFLCFVIDVSGRALLSGLVSLVASTLRQAICDGTIDQHAQVAFITYNKAVHFWELGGARKRPALHTVLDPSTPLLPRGRLFFVPAADIASPEAGSSPAAAFLLENLQRLGQAQPEYCKNGDSALATALSCALELVESETAPAEGVSEPQIKAGKIVLFHATTPVSEPGRVVLRDSVSYYGTEFEPSLFAAYSPFYEAFGERCVRAGVGVDTFLFSATYVDVASGGRVSHRTGGQVHYFHRFDVARDAWRVEAEIRRTFARAWGSAALLRVRVSAGLSVAGYPGFVPNFGEPDTVRLATVDADKAVGVTFKYDARSIDPLDGNSVVVVQSALLYSDPKNGCRRRLRVSTLCAPVSICAQGVFNGADRDATLALTARTAAAAVLAGEKLPADIFASTTETLVHMLSEYRASCSSHAPASQLVLPEAFALLPLSVLSFCKMSLLRKEIKPDIRCAAAFQILSEPPAATALRFHPRVYSLAVDGGAPAVPLRLSVNALDQDGVYFVDDGLRPMVWIGKKPRADVLQDLFGEAAASRNCAVLTQKLLSVLQGGEGEGEGEKSSAKTPSSLLRSLVGDAVKLRGHANFAVTVANGEEGSYPTIWQILVEDSQGPASPSYTNYLRTLHSAILKETGQYFNEQIGY